MNSRSAQFLKFLRAGDLVWGDRVPINIATLCQSLQIFDPIFPFLLISSSFSPPQPIPHPVFLPAPPHGFNPAPPRLWRLSYPHGLLHPLPPARPPFLFTSNLSSFPLQTAFRGC
jgi:hypothetical protein